MKTSFTYNLLRHLYNKKEEGGFTLVELLVVIIILSILAVVNFSALFGGSRLNPQEARLRAESNLKIWIDTQGYHTVTGFSCLTQEGYLHGLPCHFTVQQEDGDLETTSLFCSTRKEDLQTGQCGLLD